MRSSDPDSPPRGSGNPAAGWPGWVMWGVGLTATASLVLEYGFAGGTQWGPWLHAAQAVAAIVYGLDLLAALLRLEPRWPGRGAEPAVGPYRARPVLVLSRRWFEFLMLALLVLGVAARERLGLEPHSLVPVQIFLLVTVAVRVLRVQDRLLNLPVATEFLFMASYGVLILVGACLLMLPRALKPDVAPLLPMEALFTATSASTVTGLTLRETGSTFSGLGIGILTLLIQLGGLGIITFVALVSVTSGKLFSVPQMVSLKSLFSARAMSDVRRQILAIVLLTVVCEAVGAALLFFCAPPGVEAEQGLLVWAVFHSISAFCNAGFTLGELSLGPQGDVSVSWILMSLIVVGGIGYPVLRDCVRVRGRWQRGFEKLHGQRRHMRFGLHSRVAVSVTLVLLVVGASGFAWLEWEHSLRGQPIADRLFTSLLQSVTVRTAGFQAVEVDQMQAGSRYLVESLMLIGAGPVSTGGGLKTVTFGVLLAAVVCYLKRSGGVSLMGRPLATWIVKAAAAVFVAYCLTAALLVAALSVTDPDVLVRDSLFEVVSALSTVGLSADVAQRLGMPGQTLLCLAMFLGRVGPLVLVLRIARAAQPASPHPDDALFVS